MNNISCQQLTEGIKTFQRLKNEYDSVPSDNKEKIKRLSEIRTTVETLHDRLMIDCAGKEIFYLDYKGLELFAKNHLMSIEWLLSNNNHNGIEIGGFYWGGRVLFLSIYNKKPLDLNWAKCFKDLSAFTFYNSRAKTSFSFESFRKLESVELDHTDLSNIDLFSLPLSVKELKLNNTSLDDLSFAKRLTGLEWLEIKGTKCFRPSNVEKNSKIHQELADRGIEVFI